MRRFLAIALMSAALFAAAGSAVAAEFQRGRQAAVAREDFVVEPMPPGIHVISTELEGPVFADVNGRTLYHWPLKGQRNGNAGEQRGRPTCDDTRYRESAGLMSPYPPGLELPDVDTRPSCVQMWPPLLAAADAKPVGKWTILDGPGGRKQWAYDGFAMYTSVLDKQPGDVNGGTKRRNKNDAAAYRQPVGPRPNVPSQFDVYAVATGRMVGTAEGFSVYYSDRDGRDKSNCDGECLMKWTPVLAPDYAKPIGEWSIFERAPGIKQWAFRTRPVYTHVGEEKFLGFEGSDFPGWHNVYTQYMPDPPKGFFTMEETRAGIVLADARGMTVYVYNCGEDAPDALLCDHPDSTQAYRYMLCGRDSSPADCVRNFPYVLAPKDAVSGSQVWTVMHIDPKTGHRATAEQTDGLYVWAFRGRPIYTFARDRQPGDLGADAWGEFMGKRNGYKAFWLRDAFRELAQ